MEHLKALTPQQLVIAACSTALVASILFSDGNKLGWVVLALAAACGIGAFVQSRK